MAKIIDRSVIRPDIDKFARSRNVERYRRLLRSATDPERRKYLVTLIAAEEQKQRDAGDPKYLY